MKKHPLFLALLICLLLLTACNRADHATPALNETLLPQMDIPLAAGPGTAQSTAPAEPTTPATPARLTIEEAKAIALKHAAVPADQIRFLRVDFDYDDGVPRYEVEFVSNGWEYEYDIHAETGRILSFDKDR